MFTDDKQNNAWTLGDMEYIYLFVLNFDISIKNWNTRGFIKKAITRRAHVLFSN